MKLVQAIFLFSCKISYVYPSRPENEVGMFCDGSALVPQVYCQGAEHDDHWTCTKKKRVRCGCGPGFARQTNNKCVPLNTCQINYNLGEHFGVKTKAQGSNVQTGAVLQKTESSLTEQGSEVLKLLQNTTHMHLVKISSEVEMNKECLCLKSTFKANIANKVERTLECYYNVSSKAAHDSLAQVKSPHTIISRGQHADFTVRSIGSQTTIVVQFAPLPAEVTDINQEAIYLDGTFVVLEASDGCLLTALKKGNEVSGRRICALWNSEFAVPNEASKCVTTLSECTEDVVDLMNHKKECKEYDASEERKQKRADEEITKE
ncbi:uncharacterized protein [Dermacentor andersoni]|uniref:uncharacterized protein n=1 Tax=Dermacentor andersoni TaxID=34620 RepID=UPI003B3B65A6